MNSFHQPKVFLRNLILCGCALLASPVFATPADEITRAVAANGVANISEARPRQFLKAFRALTLRVTPRDLPEYVTGAIKLRPDLAPNIAAVAVKAVMNSRQAKPELSCTMIQRIVTAAIVANPDAAVAIARAGASAAPTSRRCIIAAAVAVAPGLKEEIVEAAMAKILPLAFLTYSASDSTSFSSWGASMNPANISQVGGNGAVNSPEQPPAH